METRQITGLLLAGGLGTRMGGRDKGLVPLEGRPLAAQVLERLSSQVGSLLINANRNADRYGQLGPASVIPDRLPGFLGPLAGLDAAFHCPQWHGEWILTSPCDTPRLPADLAHRLLAAALAEQADLALPAVHGQLEPAFLLAHRRLAPSLARYLKEGGRRIQGWTGSTRHVIVDFSDQPGAFININTPAELDAP